MNSELQEKLQKLLNLRDKLEKRIDELKREYAIENDERKKDFYERLEKKYENLCDLLEKINRINEQLKQDEINFKNSIGTPDEEQARKTYEQNYDLMLKYIEDGYSEFKKIIDSNFELKERVKLNKKVVAGVSAVAILITMSGVALHNTIKEIKNTNTKVDGNGSSSSQEQNPKEESTNENKVSIPELDNEAFNELTKVENKEEISEKAEIVLGVLDAVAPNHNYTLEDIEKYLEVKNGLVSEVTNTQTKQENMLTDITDTEKVAQRGSELTDIYNKYVPYLGIDEDYAINAFNWINGGAVNNVSLDEGAFVIDTYVDLLVAEKGNAEDVICGRNSDRKTPTETIDYGMFFLDGTRGQKLANKLGKLRSDMILNAGKDISEYQKEFAELFLNSWILRGHEEISAASLETSGMEAMIDLMFLNTAPLCGDPTKIVITNPADGKDITLAEIIQMANTDECEAELVDENGVVIETYDGLDKSTSDLIGMVSEAAMNKQLKSGSSYTLSK